MLILLPPSEGKTSPSRGARLALTSLSEPSLNQARTTVIDALINVCAKQPKKAVSVLGLGPKQRDAIAANAHLKTAPTAPAIEIYSGVLYEALDAASLSTSARRRQDTSVRIASALFGLLAPPDAIPTYRLSADVKLPGIPKLADIWRAPVGEVIASASMPILDLRSAAYATLAPAPEHALVGRVLLERNGKRSVVSHHNKATKGRLVRGLVERRALPKSDDQLLDALNELGYRCEVHDGNRRGQPAVLDIIVNDL